MDPRQEQELEILLKARRRANKVLAKQRRVREEAEKQRAHLVENWDSLRKFGTKLVEIAEECGIISLLQKAASEREGSVFKEVNYYKDYGPGALYLAQTKEFQDIFVYRTTYLALFVRWEEPDSVEEVEVRVRRNGIITFHNSWLPVFRFMWIKNKDILQRKFEKALLNPRSFPLTASPVK